MSAGYFSDYQSYVSSASVHSPTVSPLETPQTSRSRRSSRRGPSREPSISPPPLPNDSFRNGDDGVFQMDSKRFTPTLHASLVSEILTLRRELESKHKFIEGLETSFASVKNENETLNHRLAKNTKESRLAEQRFKTMENETLDAVQDLVRERDEAKKITADMKARLEALNRAAKRQDEHTVQSQKSWDKEKESWDNERRQLERKVHVTESRLRVFIEEMGVRQALGEEQAHGEDNDHDNSAFKDSGFGDDSDVASSVRSYKHMTHRSHRRNQSSFSVRSFAPGSPKKSAALTNLADELGVDEEDEYDQEGSENDDDEDLLSDSRLGCLPGHRSSLKPGCKAKKVLGLTDALVSKSRTSTDSNTMTPMDSFQHSRSNSKSTTEVPSHGNVMNVTATRNYVDTGVQPSEFISPRVFPAQASVLVSSGLESGSEVTAKYNNHNKPEHGTSTDAQNVDQMTFLADIKGQHTNVPLSPPETPILLSNPMGHEPKVTPISEPKPTYISSYTQTDLLGSISDRAVLALRRNTQVEALPIPLISIHPPLSAPTSPGQPVLPPGTIDGSTQTDPMSVPEKRDSFVQTEEIRIDTRPIKLPPHLLPSTLETALEFVDMKSGPSNMPEIASHQSFADGPPRRNSARLRLKALDLPRPILLAAAREDERRGEDPKTLVQEDDVVKTGHARSPSLGGNFTSWRDSLDEKVEVTKSQDVSDNMTGSTRYPARSAFNGPPKTVPEDREISPAHFPFSTSTSRSTSRPTRKDSVASLRSARGRTSSSRSTRGRSTLPSRSPSPTSRASTSHSGTTQPPPFPIPFRSSSRSRGATSRASNSSPSPYSKHDVRLGLSDHESYLARKRSVRKVHSSSSIKTSAKVSPRRRRRAPQLTPIQSMAFDGTPPFDLSAPYVAPQNDMPFSPLTEDDRATAKEAIRDNESAIEENDRESVIVDAIAATMVGEWLWKYVRRRKSFGISEGTPGEDGMHGVTRHKRWVWLSPYERTIMWSSKQPNTGSALLGKNGRKLIIKTVLDVKDDKPLPKAATADAVFDRSILILTPERALKFTAPNRDRHYLWLTALSFLAQSGRGQPGVPRVPQPKPIEESSTQRPIGPSMGLRKRSTAPPQGLDQTAPNLPTLGEPFQPRPNGSAISPPTTSDAAEAPIIPRVGAYRHQRKRSSSNPSVPPTSRPTGLRSFSSTAVPTSLTRTSTATSSHKVNPGNASLYSGGGRSTPTASPEKEFNFFEAVETVRMDAFVHPNYHDGVLYLPTPPPAVTQQQQQSARWRDGSIRTSCSTGDERKSESVLDERDYFKGF